MCIVVSAWITLVLLMMLARLFPPRLSRIRALLLLGRATPRDIGFEYEESRLEVHPPGLPPVTLSTWLVRPSPPSQQTIVLLHGYADASPGAAAWLPMLHQARRNVLLIDLPGHGESSRAPCTAGARERHHVCAVIDQMKQRRPDEMKQIILFGLSMGGAVALGIAQLRSDIAAIVLDSPYSDYRRAAINHARLFGLPGAIFQRPGAWLVQRLLHVDFDDVSPILLIPKTRCPVLLIQAGEDCLISPQDAQAMAAMVDAKGQHDHLSKSLTIPAAHLLSLAANPDLYTQEVQDFLSRLSAEPLTHQFPDATRERP